MDIYIDESGSFVLPSNGKHVVSCVAGLAIPSASSEQLFADFFKLRDTWMQGATEVKGSTLDELRIAEVVSLLKTYDAVLKVCAIDLGIHSERQITEFKRTQAHRITEGLGPSHQSSLIREMNELKSALLSLPNQLFVQSFATILLIDDLLQDITLYHSQRLPVELGEFHWVVDAKDKNITPFEKTWSTLILPVMQTMSRRKSFTRIFEGDYSSFEKFIVNENNASEEMKEYIEWFKKTLIAEKSDVRFSGIDIKAILKDIQFENSEGNIGIQLVDIVSNAVCRSLNGKLQKPGWDKLGSLMIRKSTETLRMIWLSTDPNLSGKQISGEAPYRFTLEGIENTAKPMFL